MKGSFDIPVSSPVQRRYNRWKSLIPVIYDWFANHNLFWPSLSCRWGPRFDETTYKNHQRLYLSEQTDGSVPNTLIIADCEVVKPRVASAEHIGQFDEEERSPNVKKHKAIIHPGEVNRIREMPQNNNLVATHTDSPEVLIWDTDAQPARHAILGAATSRPDLILTGHTDNAEFALAMCPTEPFVLSGGRDTNVILWSINDQIASLAAASNARQGSMLGGSSPSVEPRGIFRGHTDTVEDVQFCPTSAQEFCSVGDDSSLMLWDARAGAVPVLKVEGAHEVDIHCVEWNDNDVNFILTGSADKSIHMYDRRNLNNGHRQHPVHTFEGHDAAVLCVQWCPDKSSVFGTAGEDGIVNIWDHEKVGSASASAGINGEDTPPGLFFQHVGHRNKVVEFHWNPSDPWTIVSASNDSRGPGGGTLQMWRMMDIIHGGEDEERIEELNKFRPCTVGRDPSSLKNLSLSLK